MRLKVCASGLKATTRQHGLTEYWANRITHCCAPKNYPRVFCWIYRHEGRKLKHELRCHAVLCSKEKQVQEICDTLKVSVCVALKNGFPSLLHSFYQVRQRYAHVSIMFSLFFFCTSLGQP